MDWKLKPFEPEDIETILRTIQAANIRADELALNLYPYSEATRTTGQLWIAQVRTTKYGSSASYVSLSSVSGYGPISISNGLAKVLTTVEPFPYLTVHVHKHRPNTFCAEFKCEMMVFGADLKPVEMPGMPADIPQAVSSPPPPVSGPEHEMTSWSQEPTTLTPNEYDVLRGKAKRYEEIRKLLGYEV